MIPLTRRNILDYLLDRNLVTPESVVDGDYLVAAASSRNRNFKVIRHNHPSYFVKQIERRQPEAIASLQREAIFYLRNPLPGLGPKYYDYDPAAHILILELYVEGETLTWSRWRNQALPVEIAAALGRALAQVHSVAPQTLDSTLRSYLPQQPPWCLSLHHMYNQPNQPQPAGMSAANRQMVEILRKYPDFPRILDKLRDGWRRDAVLHGDLKWENCLIVNPQATAPDLKILDWELVDIGDAAWDAGALLQAFLADWVMSMAIPAGARADQLEQYAQSPLEHSHGAIQAFWDAYRQGRPGLDAGFLERAASYGAARMVQTVYEYAFQEQQLNAHHICLLQLSLNMLRDPRRALNDLYHLQEARQYAEARR